MNNSTDGASMDMMTMTPWLHFGKTDYLVFKPWRPSSVGAIVGACLGLFLFCILDRCLAACRRWLEMRWRTEINLLSGRAHSSSGEKQDIRGSANRSVPVRMPLVPAFTPSRDILRGIIQAIQTTFSYALMLVVMTFNGAYIISVIVGLGIGEVLFGRVGRGAHIDL